MRKGYKQTEVGVIPEDWDVKLIDDLAEKVMVGIASAATHAYRPQGIPLLRNQNIKKNYLQDDDLLFVDEQYELIYKNKRLKTGDLLTARTGYPGTTCIIPPKYDGAQCFTTIITRLKKNEVNSDYLCHYINSEYGLLFIEKSKIGGGQKNIGVGIFQEMPIPIPSPAEQEAIAEALSDADALIESLETLLAKKRQVKQGTMSELLTGKRRVVESGEWKVKLFGELASIRKQKIDPRKNLQSLFCVELEHIEQGTGRLIGSSETSETSSIKSVFQKGDVLFGKLRAYLRKYWLADRDGVCTTEIWALIANPSLIIKEYLFQLVQMDGFIEVASMAYGTHMPRTDWNVVKNYEFSVPELPEQTAIAEILSDMDAEIRAVEEKLSKARAVKAGMMSELLTGRVRVV